MYPEYYRTDADIAHEDERFFPFLPFLGGIALGGLLAGPRPFYGPQYMPAPYPVPYPVPYSTPYPAMYSSAMPVSAMNQGFGSVPNQLGINETINIYPR